MNTLDQASVVNRMLDAVHTIAVDIEPYDEIDGRLLVSMLRGIELARRSIGEFICTHSAKTKFNTTSTD